MRESKLSSKSQIVIPASVRKDLGLELSDRVVFACRCGRVSPPEGAGDFMGHRLVSAGELRGYAEQLLRDREESDA